MPEAIVSLQSVSRQYVLNTIVVDALRPVSLDIYQGEYAVIMGPSGSGKSTLLNLLGCLDRPSAGTYLLGGRDVSDLSDDELSQIRSREIGFIFQSYNLIQHLNVLENIEVPLYYQDVPEREARERATDLANRMGLSERLLHRPTELSGGQQQRVAIARSLASNPLIILADEPTGNLDTKTGQEILELIDELNNEGKTIIMVTHDDDIADRAHRRILLRDGEILSNTTSTPRRLRENSNTAKETSS